MSAPSVQLVERNLPASHAPARSDKFGLVYVITKLGLLFVYDLETATAVYRTRISADPIFLAAPAVSSGGFIAINRRACACACLHSCEQLLLRAYASARALGLASLSVVSSQLGEERICKQAVCDDACVPAWA